MAGRPREFDTEIALDAAMHAFWAKGYEATSLTDLMDATGLHRGSLYQAFGDKHALFMLALNRYLSEMRRQKTQILKNAPTPLEGLQAVAHALIDMADANSACPMGCMAINTLVELAPHDDEVRRVMERHVAAMRASLEETILLAQEAGQIDSIRPPALITSLMMTFMAGLAANMKGPLSNEQAHALVDAQIEMLI